MNKIFCLLILVGATQTTLAAESPAPPGAANDQEVVAEPLPKDRTAPPARQKPAKPHDYGSKFAWVIEGALEFGGDTVDTVVFQDGSTQKVKSGQGVTIAGGAQYRASRKSPFTVNGALGYKFVSTRASNANIGIDRLVLELTGRYRYTPDWWLGAGLVRHNGIKFDTDGFGTDIEFKDATGFAAELGWRWVALSFTKIIYTADTGNEPGKQYDASNFGLIGTYAFD